MTDLAFNPGGETATGSLPDKTLLAKASRAYAAGSRQADEQKWILTYLPMVRHIVQKVSGSLSHYHDVEDLISAGTLGLVKAARAFDSTKDADFKTYAYIRIRGAVLDELRGRSFVPSSVHKEIRRVRAAYQEHVSQTGQPPSDEQLADGLGITMAQLYRTLEEVRRQNFLSIHGLSEEQPALTPLQPADRAPAPDEQAERRELLDNLAQAIRELPQRDRLVVLLYYDRDLTMKEAAAVLGITESRFSQLHASAVFKLSMKMGAGR